MGFGSADLHPWPNVCDYNLRNSQPRRYLKLSSHHSNCPCLLETILYPFRLSVTDILTKDPLYASKPPKMKCTVSSCLAAATLGLLAGQSAARSIRSTSTNRTAPHFPSRGQEDVVDSSTSPQYYIAWFIPPSGADITSFVSTMTIPDVSANTGIGVSAVPTDGCTDRLTISAQPRYVWPGMENAAGDFVYQDVIGDQQPEGEWTFATWYVGDG